MFICFFSRSYGDIKCFLFKNELRNFIIYLCSYLELSIRNLFLVQVSEKMNG